MYAISSVSPYHMARSVRATSSAEKLTVPVQRAASLYAHFKYVKGVSSGAGDEGLSLAKVRTLNTLIDNLVKIKGNKIELPEKSGKVGMSDKAVDAMIEGLQKELHTAATQVTPSFSADTAVFSGSLLNLTA